MEVLGGAASGMAVASLALQLLQSIDTIKTFAGHVKGATKELERLVELLANLSVLLDHVRTVMEKQTSLEHCPLPAQAIFECLKACEKSVTSLEQMVTKHGKKITTNTSGMGRLGHDVKFAFKARDITNLEDRIQRDITYLSTALGVNGANMQLTTLAILMRLEQTALLAKSPDRLPVSDRTRETCSQPSTIMFENMQMLPSRSKVGARTQKSLVTSFLQRFGIHQRRMKRYVIASNDQSSTRSGEEGRIISSSYDIVCNLLGHGIHWSRRYHCGNILPSLRVYPVVERFDFLEPGHSWMSSIEEVQQSISSGVLHPFTKDLSGNTLLYYAAVSRRPDICRLLAEYGLKPEVDSAGYSPLSRCLLFLGTTVYGVPEHEWRQAEMDTVRLLLLQFDQVDGIDTSFRKLLRPCSIPFLMGYREQPLDLVEWLWNLAAETFHGADLACFRAKLVQELVYSYETNEGYQSDLINKLLIKLMDEEILELYLSGEFSLLTGVLHFFYTQDGGWRLTNFIDLLHGLGLDIGTCLSIESRHYSNHLDLKGPCSAHVTYEQLSDREWVIKRDWIYQEDEPGYLVVSELNAFSGDADGWEWPFPDPLYEFEKTSEQSAREYSDRVARFERQTAAKARKQRAANGEKLPRSKMPGAWN